MPKISTLFEPSRRWVTVPVLILMTSGIIAAIVLSLGASPAKPKMASRTIPTPRTVASPSPENPVRANPAAAVRNYVAAINTQDYAEAWAIGGVSTGESYSTFVNDFATTAYDHLTIYSASSTTVTAQLIAYQVTGAAETYRESYRVSGSHIVSARLLSEGSTIARISPADILREYVSAINRQDYAEAWAIEGRSENIPYPLFAQGFDTTARDKLIILSESGRTVRARLIAYQTDGSVKIFQGTYTMDAAFIVHLDVSRVS